VLIFWVVDNSRWFLFATDSLGERPSVSPWRKKQPEGLTRLILLQCINMVHPE